MSTIKPRLRADRHLIQEVAKQLDTSARRRFLNHSISLGSLAMLTGCDASTEAGIESMLSSISRINDQVQWGIFNPGTLAQTYPDSMIQIPFRFNAFYGVEDAPKIDGSTWKLSVSGLVKEKKEWSLADLMALPQTAHTTRHICVEGWSMIGKWGGVTLRSFLERIGADLSARYVGFKCADDYFTSIDMPTALHPQTLMAFTFADQTLPTEFGYPMKIRMPTKLGYKNPKHVMAVEVSNNNPGGYWEDQGYNWFGGL